MRRRECLKLAAVAVPARAAPSHAPAVAFPTQVASSVERMFRTPQEHPNGLEACWEGLWVVDVGGRVALLGWNDGHVIREFPTETKIAGGITFDGAALWIAATLDRLLLRVDAQTGKTLKQLPSPGVGLVKWGPRGAAHQQPTGAHGLEWRAGRLWAAVPPSRSVFVVNPEDGSEVNRFPVPSLRPHGLGWDPDGALWYADSIYRSFFKMDPKTGRIIKQIMLPATAPEVDGIVHVPHGMSVWKGHFWFSVDETGEVYRVPLAA